MGLFSISKADAERRLEAATQRVLEDPAIRNAVLHVDAPRAGVSGTWAAGVADERDQRTMGPQSPFFSASIGKIAMAATAVALARDGRLDLDAPIATWLSADVLDDLPVVGGPKGARAITVRMLLANRSGLPDYFDNTVHPSTDGAPSVLELMVAEPQRTWTREALIQYAKEHYRPFSAPGEAFLYSDLNWDLLGLVFEAVTGGPFFEDVRQRVLEPLAMAHTWYHAFETRPKGVEDVADAFVGEVNLARAPCMSLDQAGGGLGTTAEDLGKLLRGLEAGVPAPLEALGCDWTENAMSRGLDYGYGTWRWRPPRIFFLLWQLPQLVGVSGSTNAFAYRTASGDVIAGTLDQADDPSRHVKFVLSKVLPVLARVRTTD